LATPSLCLHSNFKNSSPSSLFAAGQGGAAAAVVGFSPQALHFFIHSLSPSHSLTTLSLSSFILKILPLPILSPPKHLLEHGIVVI